MIKRQLGQRLSVAARQMPVVSITGPRQSGKTTLCKQTFPGYFYMNLENPQTRIFAKEDPVGFLRQSQEGMIIDEAQNVPELFSYIQVQVDESKRNGEYVLTGSQNFLFMEKISQSLAGRVAVFHLLPFSQEELKSTPYAPSNVFEFIYHGGYPRIYDQQVDLDIFFSSYVQTYLERDVRQLINIGDLEQFQLFCRICAGRIGQLFNQSAIANETGLSHPTVKKWLSLLQTSFIAYTLPPYFKNFNKRLIKTHKLYFYDTGLACYLLGIRSADELENHYARGALFENFIITEIMKNFYNLGHRQILYFWRDKTGHEIDLLVDIGGKIYPIEIKSSKTISAQFFKNLEFFSRISNNIADLSTVIYAGDMNQKRSQGHIRSWRNLPDFNRD